MNTLQVVEHLSCKYLIMSKESKRFKSNKDKVPSENVGFFWSQSICEKESEFLRERDF